MIPFFFHPSRSALMAFASGEPLAGRARVARHLAACSDCRQFVGFAQRLEKATANLPSARASDDLLSRALSDRAAGVRVILPAPMQPVHSSSPRNAIRLAGIVIAAALVGFWWNGRRIRGEFTSANELLLAGFVPRSAEAGQAGRHAGPMTHRLRPIAVTYRRRFIDSSSGLATDAGSFDVRVARGGSDTWLVTSEWRDIAGRTDMQGARTWSESLTVADTGLAPLSRIVHVKPYRRWAGILISQRFRNDSVIGQMSLDEDPTRRPIARDLRSERERLVASDALAPLYYMGVPLLTGAEFDVTTLGWAVVPSDVFLPMRMRVIGSERIETPAGAFDCWRFVISVGGETHYHWVRKSDHLGVRTRRRMSDGRLRELVLINEETKR